MRNNLSINRFVVLITLFCLESVSAQKNSFKEVVDHIKAEVSDLVVLSSGNSKISVSPSYQGRVFTSSTNGWDGESRGWINWKLLEEGNSDKTMTYLGGESRLWFAPEFGKFSIFHKPGDSLTPKAMRPPKGLEETLFQLVEKDSTSITVKGDVEISNYQGFNFQLSVDRHIRLLSKEDIQHQLDIVIDETTDYVGFNAYSVITNKGADWETDKGLIGIWELGCNLTSVDNKVIIPLSGGKGKVTPYFGDLTLDRVQIKEDVVYFKSDASYLNKIGIPPSHSKNVMGSYSLSKQLLSIVVFKFTKGARYMSSDPIGITDPYKGDVINIFNGEVIPAENHNWPFFEFESSSEAKALKNGESLSHYQTTFHFEGDFNNLNKIAKGVLGVDLKNIPDF